MTGFRKKLIELLENRARFNNRIEFERAYGKIRSEDSDGSPADRLILDEIGKDYRPYFRGWLDQTDLQISYSDAMFDLMLERLKCENDVPLEQCASFRAYKNIQAQIAEDMKNNPAKYSSNSGDIEW